MQTNCSNCGAGLVVDKYQDQVSCQYCRTVHVPSLREAGEIEKLEGVASGLHCPCCAGSLGHARLATWQFQFCAKCHGLLLDGADLLQIIEYLRRDLAEPLRAPRPIDPAELERRIACPACASVMAVHPYYGPGDFVIDRCASCQRVWLDAGELGSSTDVRWGGTLWQ